MNNTGVENLDIAIPIAERVKPSKNIAFWIEKALKKRLKSMAYFPEMLEFLNLRTPNHIDFKSISKNLDFDPTLDYSRELKRLKVSTEKTLEEVKETSTKITLMRPVITKLLLKEDKKGPKTSTKGKLRKRRRKEDLELKFKVKNHFN